MLLGITQPSRQIWVCRNWLTNFYSTYVCETQLVRVSEAAFICPLKGFSMKSRSVSEGKHLQRSQWDNSFQVRVIVARAFDFHCKWNQQTSWWLLLWQALRFTGMLEFPQGKKSFPVNSKFCRLLKCSHFLLFLRTLPCYLSQGYIPPLWSCGHPWPVSMVAPSSRRLCLGPGPRTFHS